VRVSGDLCSDPLLQSIPIRDGCKSLGGVRLEEKLGQGGMGAVYRGKHLRLGVDVAVKVMARPLNLTAEDADTRVKRFLREAHVAAMIDHPALVRVVDVNSAGDLYYLVMDFVDGESAGDCLKRRNERLPEADAVAICLGAAEGLAEAHRKGVVHRDVKPDNIMIGKDGRVRVTDLGLAKATSHDEDASAPSALTQTQSGMGTPFYMPPEQFRAAHDVTPAADVWSLGVTLYQLATAELPWTDSSVFEMAEKIKHDPLPDPREWAPDLSDGFCAIIEKAVAKSPADRYPDGGAMAAALRAHLGAVGGETRHQLAGSRELALASVTPLSKTLTIISKNMLDTGRAGPRADSGRVMAGVRTAGTYGREALGRNGARMVLVGLLLVALLGVVGFAAWHLLSEPGAQRERRNEMAVLLAKGDRQNRDADAKVAAILQTARSFRDAGLLEKARDKASEALEITASHPETKRFLANVSGQIASRQAEAERAAAHKKWLDEGLRLRLGGKLHEAATAYERAQSSAPAGNTDAATAAAECLAEDLKAQAMEAEATGDLERAVKLYAQATAKRNDADTGSRLDRAKQKLDAMRAEEARRAEASRWRTRAEEAERRGDRTAALEYYREAANHGADVSSQVSSLEQEASRREVAARMQAAYETAMARARSHAKRNRWTDAVAGYEEALRHKPGDATATGLMAEAKSKLAPTKTMTLDLGDGVSMEFVLIPSGEFVMGSPASEEKRGEDEGPRHPVRITRAFYLGKHEVTQAQYERIAGKNPSRFKGTNLPVEQVSWNDATSFCRQLARRTGKAARLPTEAEWEYACRAGTTTPFSCGASLGSNQANFNGKHPYGNAATGTYLDETTNVGGYAANAWGLHDMHGNVWEWCSDWYHEGYYAMSMARDPRGPTSGRNRVLRGGSWGNFGNCCRSALRYWLGPMACNHFIGFRVAVSVAAPER